MENPVDALKNWDTISDDTRTHMRGLRSLFLVGTVEGLTETLRHLTNLRKLYMNRCFLTSVPIDVCCLERLELLSLSNYPIQDPTAAPALVVPEYIRMLSNLTTLDLQYNNIETLPDSIGQLVALTVLHLENNELESLPDSFHLLTELQELYLDHNGFDVIPHSIMMLGNLIYLNLSHNYIEIIPESIIRLGNLEHLDLSNNYIEVIPDSIMLLDKLSYLNLSHNYIEVIPESIGKSMVKDLFLNDNNIAEIPESVTSMANLYEIRFHNTRIETIPLFLGSISSLREISIKDAEASDDDDNVVYGLRAWIQSNSERHARNIKKEFRNHIMSNFTAKYFRNYDSRIAHAFVTMAVIFDEGDREFVNNPLQMLSSNLLILLFNSILAIEV